MEEKLKELEAERDQIKQEKEDVEVQLRRCEKAKDSYKEQTLDLKQDVRQLKQQLEVYQTKRTGQTILEDTIKLHDTTRLNDTHDSLASSKLLKQKEAVLGDIRNLI